MAEATIPQQSISLVMNRQAKRKGFSEWTDMGAVTFERAAIDMVERLGLTTDKVTLTLRDEDDKVEFDVVVDSFRAYKVTGLRGGE